MDRATVDDVLVDGGFDYCLVYMKHIREWGQRFKRFVQTSILRFVGKESTCGHRSNYEANEQHFWGCGFWERTAERDRLEESAVKV